ncbi:MAG: flagellar biosynthesis protein FliQ [Deltaproteobacteria bacterium]
MEQGAIIELATRALLVILYVSGPMMLLALVVGLAVSIFQATTQIQEQTLTFVPKLIAILGGVLIFGPWMLQVLKDFTLNLFQNINMYVR